MYMRVVYWWWSSWSGGVWDPSGGVRGWATPGKADVIYFLDIKCFVCLDMGGECFVYLPGHGRGGRERERERRS